MMWQAGPRRQLPDAKMALVVLLICFVFNMLGRGIGDTYVTFLLPLETEFGWTRSELSSVYSIYMVANGLSAPFVGILFDRWGPRLVYLLGVGSLGLGYFLAGNLTQLWQFHLCIGVAGGIGISAIGMVPSASLISRWFPHSTSTAIGIAYAGFGAGTLVLVPFAQYLNQAVGWRDAYHVMGGSLLIALPIVMLLPWRVIRAGYGAREKLRNSQRAVDDAFTNANTSVQPKSSPLRAALRHSGFWGLAQAFFFTSVVVYTVLVQMIAYLVSTGFTPIEAASAFGFAGMLSVLGVGSAGRLADVLGPRRTATLTFMCTTLGLASLLALSYFPSHWFLMSFVVFFGIAQGARGPIISGLCSKLFPGPGLATIYGVAYACMSVGAATGAMMSGFLYDWTGGYQASIIFSMLNVILAVSPFWVYRELRKFG
ncbi:MFS transporter [Zwartia sp.]|uniref:MFS transporter n=1 Tax=Zwartia sp. TaxID=2978004 RepID=UPI003BAE2911